VLRGPEPTLSYSAISTYRECPLQYWYRYRLRLPAPPTVEAQLGTIVHEAIASAGRRRRDGASLGEASLLAMYEDAWEAVAFVDPRRRPVLEALGWRWVRDLWARGELEAAPAFVEEPFTVPLEGWTLRGIIDRVEPIPGREAWRIVDFKSGRPLPTTELRRDLQLALYALGARRGLALGSRGAEDLDGDTLELEIRYLRGGEGVRLAPDDRLLERAEAAGRDVADKVRQGRFEARPTVRRCRLCAYRLACPSGQ
ncbi:MAG: PD-(D/E)XK nuclease family protein, partial [Candidatus Dormiibacterota bacterium]